MFTDLHSFNPYRPLSLGVRSKLVDLKSGEFMWAVDESIDAGDASVMVTAIAYQRKACSGNISGHQKQYTSIPQTLFKICSIHSLPDSTKPLIIIYLHYFLKWHRLSFN